MKSIIAFDQRSDQQVLFNRKPAALSSRVDLARILFKLLRGFGGEPNFLAKLDW